MKICGKLVQKRYARESADFHPSIIKFSSNFDARGLRFLKKRLTKGNPLVFFLVKIHIDDIVDSKQNKPSQQVFHFITRRSP